LTHARSAWARVTSRLSSGSPTDGAERVEVELAARATGHAVRVGLLSADGSSFIQEIELRPEPEFSRIKLAARRATQAIGSLVVRASAQGGGTAELSFVHV
jgi:hypothetical protein